MSREYQLALSVAELIDDYQMILPFGKFNTAKYGEIEIPREWGEKMVEHWQARAMGEREPYVDVDHTGGEAQGWIKDLQVRDDGLYARVEWTALGRDKVDGKIFRYFSAEFGPYTDLETGEEIFPVLTSVALTNRPVMSHMKPVHLSEGDTDIPAHGDGANHNNGVSDMNLNETLDALFALEDERGNITDEQREKIREFAGIKMSETSTDTEALKLAEEKIENMKTQLETVLEENKEMGTKLSEYEQEKHDARKSEVIEAALSEGKILPKNREKWEGMFDKDPEGIVDLLNEKGAEVDLSEKGTGDGGGEMKFSEAELAEFHKMGIDDETIKTYGGNV